MAVTTKNLFRPSGQDTLKSVERQRQMAAALQGQAMQPLRGQMAGRTYVGASGLEGAGKLAQMLAGTYVQGQADDREKQIEADQRQAFMTDMNAYQDAIKGTPMIPGGIPETNVIPPQGVQGSETNPYIPASGEFKEAADIPAVPGMDRGQAAMQHLMNSNSPMAQRMGESIYGKSLEPKELKLHNAKTTDTVRDQYGNVVQQGILTPKNNLSSAVNNMLAVNGIDPAKATPDQLKHANNMVERNKQKVGASSVNKSEGAQAAAMGTNFAEYRKDSANNSRASSIELSKLNRMEDLLKDHDGSVMSGVFTTFQSFADGFGLTLGKNLSEKQAAISLANQLAIGMRKAGTGVMTDKDFEVYMASVPNMLMTADGRKLVTETSRKFHDRNIVINNMIMEYAKANGGLIDDGLNVKISAYMAANPVFPRVLNDESVNAGNNNSGVKFKGFEE
jgi:hypothetical protein